MFLQKKVIVDEKLVLVVTFICHTITAERHIPNGEIKETVRQIRLFKAADRNRRLRIKLLGDAARNAIQLHAKQPRVLERLRDQPEEIANTTGGFPYLICIVT